MNAPPILVGTLVVGLVDVHWGYDLGFDQWPETGANKCSGAGKKHTWV